MTLKEVAKLAGVSPAAVSRYMNGGSLSEEKSRIIREAIEKTGYVPNQAAKGLRTGSIRQVGVIVPKLHSSSVSQLLEGINQILAENNYMALLGCANNNDEEEICFLDIMQSNHVAGIILMGTGKTQAKLDAIRSCTVPVVVTGQNFPGVPCVHNDDFHAVKELTNRLLAHGRTKIAFIGVNERDEAAGVNRWRGVQTALSAAGMSTDILREESGYSASGGYDAMKRMLAVSTDFDGLVCATDSIAHGAMAALREIGKRIPEDVSVVGVGDDWHNWTSSPQLTAARLYHVECGRDAADILMRAIHGESSDGPVRQIELGYSIIDRESV